MKNLIAFAYLREITDLGQEVDDKFLQPKLKMAQDQLKFLIGRNFYTDFLNAFTPNNASSPFTSADYQNFYDPYVKEFLAWQSYEYYLVKANLLHKRTGIRVFKEQDSEPATDKQMGQLLSTASQQVQSYKGVMINFLIEAQAIDSTKYPLYIDKWPGNKMGTSFGITAIRGRDSRYSRINEKTTMNGAIGDNSPSFNNGFNNSNPKCDVC